MKVFYATLGELCSINRSGVNLYQQDKGAKHTKKGFPVIGSGQTPRGYHDDWNVESNTIIISRKGSHGRVSRYDTNAFVTDDSFYLTNLSVALDEDYLYHFLGNLVENKLKRKSRDKSVLTAERLGNMLVVFPSIRVQKTIAAYFDTLNDDNDRSGPEEPSAVLEIRNIVQHSNKDVLNMLKSRSSVQSLGRCVALFIIVMAIAVISLMYQKDGRISHWMEERFTDTTKYLKAIPMSYVSV